MVGVRSARTVLAVNPDADAPVFAVADVGIVADWREAVPALLAAIEANPEARVTSGRH
jgi:electron transfer flavoprotein alpha subunit